MSLQAPVTVRGELDWTEFVEGIDRIETLCEDMTTHLGKDWWDDFLISFKKGMVETYSGDLRSNIDVLSMLYKRSTYAKDCLPGDSAAITADPLPQALRSLCKNVKKDIDYIAPHRAPSGQDRLDQDMRWLTQQVTQLCSDLNAMSNLPDEEFLQAYQTCKTELKDPILGQQISDNDGQSLIRFQLPKEGEFCGASTATQSEVIEDAGTGEMTCNTGTNHLLLFPQRFSSWGMWYIGGNGGILNSDSGDGKAKERIGSLLRVDGHPSDSCPSVGCWAMKDSIVGEGTRATAVLGAIRGVPITGDTLRITLRSRISFPDGITREGGLSLPIDGTIELAEYGICLRITGNETVTWGSDESRSA